MKVLNLLSPVVALVLLAGPLSAQEQQTQAPSSAPSSSSSSLDMQGIRKYLLGPGDVVDVRFYGQSELNTQAAIDSDGNISSLPFLETPIRAKCRTERKSTDIVAAYSKPINKPQISVRVRAATVAPGNCVRRRAYQRAQMQRRIRLNELICAAVLPNAQRHDSDPHTEPLMPEPGEKQTLLNRWSSLLFQVTTSLICATASGTQIRSFVPAIIKQTEAELFTSLAVWPQTAYI